MTEKSVTDRYVRYQQSVECASQLRAILGGPRCYFTQIPQGLSALYAGNETKWRGVGIPGMVGVEGVDIARNAMQIQRGADLWKDERAHMRNLEP